MKSQGPKIFAERVLPNASIGMAGKTFFNIVTKGVAKERERVISGVGNSNENTVPIVRVKVRASLDDERDLTSIYAWLDKWMLSISSCQRSGGVWDDRFEIVAPSHAVRELPEGVIRSIDAE